MLIPRIGRPNFNSHLLPSFPYILYSEPFLFYWLLALLSTAFTTSIVLQKCPLTACLSFRGYLDSVVGIATRHRLDGSVVRSPLWAIFSTPVVPGLASDSPLHREYRGGVEEWRRHGRYAQSNLQKTASFIEVEPLNVYVSKHTYVLLAALIFPKWSLG